MSIIIDVIREEIERLERNEKIYQEKLGQMPKGSVVEKRRGNRIYYYLSYRENGKTKQEYLKMNKDEVIGLMKQIGKRRRLERALRNLKKERRLAEKIVAKYE